MRIIKEAQLIKTSEGQLYIQRPSSWINGLARHHWVRLHLKQKAGIVSPERWSSLKVLHETLTLVEYEDGSVEFIPSD